MASLGELARAVAIEAGELAATRRSAGVDVAATKSSAVDLVTLADREVEALIRARIAALRPDDGFFGEESDATSSRSGITWVVDPIDGTVNYVYGIPGYSVSVAAVEGDLRNDDSWTPVAGCVVNPPTGEVFTAERGSGAYLGDTRLAVNAHVSLDQALVGTGFAYLADIRAEQGAVVAALLPHVRDIRRLGSAALDLSWVACGRLDAFYERTLNPWDHAAGTLIVREAGGVVTGVGGAAPGRRAVIAAAPQLAAELESVLSAHGFGRS